jgi:rRNA biogenesis protein RRP5
MNFPSKRKFEETNGGEPSNPKKPLKPSKRVSMPTNRVVQDNILQTGIVSKQSKEDKVFPRGGASALTPLEHKEIVIEATKDALYETEKSFDHSREGKTKQHKLKAVNYGKGDRSKRTAKIVKSVEGVKIESFSYKVEKPFFGF